MKEYFAVVDGHSRRGPFVSMRESAEILKKTSRDRGYTEEQAEHFFLNESAVEQVETVGGNEECFRIGWLAREKAGRAEEPSTEDSVENPSDNEVDRNRESDLTDAHFTVTARKAAEVNEGGLVDPKVP